MNQPPPLVTIFSDFSSPFCHVTEAALRGLAAERGIRVRYMAYELYPAPEPLPGADDPPGWPRELEELASAEGVHLVRPASVPRTRKAHEAARFAGVQGSEDAMREAIYRAYWERGADISRIDTLVGLAEGIGLDPEDLRIALDIDRFSDDVAHDLDVARRLRIHAVPAIYVGTGPRARILLGAQSRAEIAAAL